jgi:SAM-dependent methyltransferase
MTLRRQLKRMLPPSVKRRIRKAQMADVTVAEGWEKIARAWDGAEGTYLGDAWHDPDLIGVDVPANQVVAHLDQEVFGPFLDEVDTLLEIGPGGGRFTAILLPRCKRLLAVETSPTMIKRLKRRFPGAPIEYVLTDGKHLPIPDTSVDAAFSYDVFVHIQHWDFFNYLREIHRVLKKPGRAIIQHANTFSDLGWRKFLTDVEPSLGRHKLPRTFTVMTPALMREFCNRAGLQVVRSVTDVVRRDCISLLETT